VRRLFYSTRKPKKYAPRIWHGRTLTMKCRTPRNAELRRRFAQRNASGESPASPRRRVPSPAGVESLAPPADSPGRQKMPWFRQTRRLEEQLPRADAVENILMQVELPPIPSRVRSRAKCRGRDNCLQAATPHLSTGSTDGFIGARKTHLLWAALPSIQGWSAVNRPRADCNARTEGLSIAGAGGLPPTPASGVTDQGTPVVLEIADRQ
jgi:hypothetical protein